MRSKLIAAVPWALLVLSLLIAIPANGRRGSDKVEPPSTPTELVDRLLRLEQENEELRRSLARVAELDGRLDELTMRTERAAQLAAGAARPVHDYSIPAEIFFCGERLPLENPDVRRRFEDQWLRFLVNRHWLMSWSRRAREAFPEVERMLAEARLPDDLKYVMVIESGVEAGAVSTAGAVGWWQFIQSTGERYGLERAGHLDERRDLAQATQAAIVYLSEMYEEFGSWALALAGYNSGERRVRDAIEEQGTRNYYSMVLPRETEAYLFKAAAAKVLLSDPERYDLILPEDGWAPVVCDTLRLRNSRARLDLKELAVEAELSFRELKALNPWFRKTWLPQGDHKLVLPRTSVARVLAAREGTVLLAEGGAANLEAPEHEGSFEGPQQVSPPVPIEPGPETP